MSLPPDEAHVGPPGAPEAEATPPGPPADRRRSLWATVLRRSLAAVVLISLAAMAALSQTREGQRLVLDEALDRIRGALAGELTIRGIRSGTLLTGATLTGIELDAADGRQFLRADSIVVRYSLPSLLLGGPPIRSTTLWGVDVEISQYSAEDVLNVTRLLAEGEPGPTESVPGGPIRLGRIGIRGGRVRVLTPAAAHSAETVKAPDGSPLRRIAFEELDLDVEDVRLRPGAAVEFEARLASLSSTVYVVEKPMVVREAYGDATFGAQGIRVQNAAFRLPATLVRGDLTMGPARPGAPWTLRARLQSDGWGDLADLAWIDGRIPSGRFRGAANLDVPGPVEVDFDRLEVELEASHFVASGWIRFDEDIRLRSLEVTASPLALSRLEPWLELDIPFDGWLSGSATFSGSLVDLAATGRLTLVPTGYGVTPTIVDVNGTIHRRDDPGATGLRVRFDPFNYTVLEAIWPDVPFAGTGWVELELNGRATDGMAIVGTFEYGTDSPSPSRARISGHARRLADGQWLTDLEGELMPLSIGVLAPLAPELGLRGTLAGPIRVEGRLDDAHVSAELEGVTGEGRLVIDGALDLGDPGAWYRLQAEADGLPLSSLMTELPEPSSWTGRLELDGSGAGLDSIQATGTFIAGPSRVGALRIDTVTAALRVSGGVLITDTLQAEVSGVDVHGGGRFGLAEGSWGSSRFAFESETLVGLRPLFMGVGDSVIVRDDLSPLETEFLRAEGIDPDTLPSELDVRMAGSVRGAASISGEIRSFDLGLVVDVVDGVYRHNEVDSAKVALTATELPRADGVWGIEASASGIVWRDRFFEEGSFEGEMVQRAGTGRIELVRSAEERYLADGSFSLEESSGSVELDEAQVRVGQDVWTLSRPAGIAWDQRSLVVDSLNVHREGSDPMSLHANGTLTRGGESDFSLRMVGLHVDRVAHVAQIDGLDVGGHMDLDLEVSGPSEAPLISGVLRIAGPRYQAMELTRLDGSLEYADRTVSFDLTGWDGVRDAITASGTLPIDLSLAAVEDRVLSRPMDVDVSADSLDAAIVLSYLTSLEQVIGIVSGEVHIGGTLDAPTPEGFVTLDDAEWSIEAIGVRHTGVNGRLALNADRTVDVELSSVGSGSSSVSGTVTLVPFRNPELDLTFAFDRFQAVERLDVEGVISGDFVLGGTYRRPVAEGSLRLDEATIYVDEFQRATGVVDLTDPILFQEVLGPDTTALVSQPLIAGLRNPFFDNLRMSVDLAVPRDTWLRSIETNIEMAGDLLVVYDRSEGDFVLIGELEAVRGSHLVLGRNFELDGGTVSFIGRPGLNPDLDIEASTRIFRRNEEPLGVAAHVGGTLIQPVVTLTTDEVGTSEADIVSYLIFGQPTTELGSSQSAMFGSVTNNTALSTGVSGGLTYVSGALANQFGAALAQTGVLDYVSVQVGGTQGNLAQQLAGQTQFEAGLYLGRDVFAVFVFRPSREEAESSNFIGGVRVEAPHVELFYEDRFLRSGAAGFALPDLLANDRVVGVFFFHDWGY